MSIHAWMLTGLLIGAPPAAPADAAPMPRLEKGLEVTWRGKFTEAILRPNVGAFRTYEVETRLFVLDVFETGADGALFTSVKLKPEVKLHPEPLPIIRLELVRVESNGKVSLLPADSLLAPPEKRQPRPLPLMAMESLPTFEPTLFVGFPTEHFRPGQAWNVPEPKRPALNYRIEGLDVMRGSRCVKVSTLQQTENWNQLRSDSTAWRRGEIIWASARHGYAVRIERTIEKRDPKAGDLAFRSKLEYDQVGHMRYPERFGQDRRDEIIGAAAFTAALERAIADRGGPEAFEALIQRIDQHVTSHFSGDAVPYREAIMSVKRKAEAAKRGHIPPAPAPPETGEAPPLTIGKPALDIKLADLANRDSAALSKLRGQPVLLIYYQPGSARAAEPVMRFAESLYIRHVGKAYVLPLAVGDCEKAAQQRIDWELNVHILNGSEAHKNHGIEATPCFVIIDDEGIVRNITRGWSDDNADAIRRELSKWLK